MSIQRPAEMASRIPDRAISSPILETAYRFAALDKPEQERSTLLTVALREHVSDTDAKTKMKWALNRSGLKPPEQAAEMIRWAVEHPDLFPDHRVMHTGDTARKLFLRRKRCRTPRPILCARRTGHDRRRSTRRAVAVWALRRRCTRESARPSQPSGAWTWSGAAGAHRSRPRQRCR